MQNTLKYKNAILITFIVVLICLPPTTSSALFPLGVGDEVKKALDTLPKGTKLHRRQAGKPNKDGWYEAKSTEVHFRIPLPVPFNDATIDTPQESPPFKRYMIGSRSLEGFRFFAMESKANKNGKPKPSMKSFVQGFRDSGSTVTDERYFQYQGYPAVEFKNLGPKSGAYTRYIECPDRGFSVVLEYPLGLEAEVKPLVSGFFNSLQIDLKQTGKSQ